jgi:NAD(P)-dependent dehydrogenase (short-subunit alcohol dehydrogenase family)
MVAQVVDQLGRVDILVNAAAKPGGQAPTPALADITEQLFLDDMQTKVMGYLRCAQAVAPHMIARAGAASSTSAASRPVRPARRSAASATSPSWRSPRTSPTSSDRTGST